MKKFLITFLIWSLKSFTSTIAWRFLFYKNRKTAFNQISKKSFNELFRVRSHAPSIRSHRGIKVVWPDIQPMRVPEEPVCIDLFRQKPVFTSLHLKYPVHVVPPPNSKPSSTCWLWCWEPPQKSHAAPPGSCGARGQIQSERMNEWMNEWMNELFIEFFTLGLTVLASKVHDWGIE